MHWLGAHQYKSVEDCISVERLNTLNTDLLSILQNINKFAAGQTRPILTILTNKAYMNFAVNFAGFFRTSFLHDMR